MTAKAPTRPFRFTRDQYREMGTLGFFDGKRVELIAGRVYELLPLSRLHDVGRRKTVDQLERAFTTVVSVTCGVPIILASSEPRPDVAVFTGNPEGDAGHPTTAHLIVEVAETTLAFDTTTKAELYATAGTADYWVLDVENRQLHVFRDPAPLAENLEATAYQTHLTLSPTDRVAPLAAPGASVLVSDLLP